MAETIRGISVVISADTTKLGKALEDVNKKSKDIQSELRQVERLLRFDPSNTTLLAQKQQLLAKQIENTSEKLNRLKSVQQQVNEQFRRGEISEGQYRAFQREIIQTESKLKHFENQLNATKNKFQELADVTKKAGEGLKKAGDSMTSAGKDLTMKVTAPVAAMGAGIIKAGMDFEATMSKVQALSGATGEELAKLEAQAKELGATTSFSASQAAEGMAFLAMAGWETKDILAGMPGLLDLAASGAMDLGRAADITSNIMSAFSIEASKASHVADVLAAASSNANTNVEQMGLAMTYLAPVANTLGWTLEEAAAAVMAMSDAGIQGEKAGAAFATSLQRLARPTNEMQKVMKQLNISFFDANGQIKPLPQLVGELEKATKNLTSEQQAAALSTLFGAEAYKNWAVLLEAGSETLGKNTKMLIEADGAAKKMAETMLDNTKGSIVEFQSALEGLAIQLSDHILPIITKLAQFATELVRRFGELSPATQKIILAIAAIAAAIGPLLIVIGSLIGAIGNIVTFVAPLIANLSVLGRAFTAVGGPIGIIIGILVTAVPLIIKHWDSIVEFFDNLWETVKTIFETVIDAIINFVKENWQTIITVISGPIGIIVTLIKNNWDSIKEFTLQIWNSIKDFFTEHWQSILTIFTGPIGLIIKLISSNWETIKNTTITVWDFIKTSLSTAWNTIKSTSTNVWNGIKNTLVGIWNGIKNTASNLWNSIKSFVMTPVNAIRDAVPSAFEAMKNKISSVWEGVKKLIKAPLNAVISMINSFISRLNGLKIPDWVPEVGGKGINIPKIPMLAKGTNFFKGGLAIVGEQGPELVELPRGSKVYPNSRTQQMVGGGDIIINVSRLEVREEADIRKIAIELNKLRERKGRAGGIG